MLSPSGNRLTSGLHEHPPKDATMVSGAALTVENLIYNVMNDQEMKMWISQSRAYVFHNWHTIPEADLACEF